MQKFQKYYARSYVLFLFYGLLLSIIGLSERKVLCQQNITTSKPNKALSHLAASKGSYRVLLTVDQITLTDKEEAESYWGNSSLHPKIVKALRIWQGKESVESPRSAFSDLSNINHIWFTRVRKGCVLHIDGGDALLSYEASIAITDKGGVVKRTVRAGETPDRYYETTQYVTKDEPAGG